ncbi:hypothetical protein Fmac_004686 [Flemingia macrophylla]|uniref:Major facilitator superfamily (MFS) profile domain-containing protein n=1 Tax=Flemingia macrophylla TaxID=520843 RepID=A0ABD1N5N9_9FABA
MQEAIVSMALAGAIIGAAVGGWINDRFGRKKAIVFADTLFFIGSAVMGGAPNPSVLIVGRVFVGLGVGMASMASPLYISEASPTRVRGALVSLNGFLITGGQFLSYLINLAFTKARGTWRWMLGVAAVPALIQIILMSTLPESPRWLFRKGREEEGKAILRKIYSPHEVEAEINTLRESVEMEIRKHRKNQHSDNVENTNCEKSPTIVQLAGFASNRTALLLLFGVVFSLVVLTVVFHQSTTHSPMFSPIETSHFNNTCPDYHTSVNPGAWDCTKCLKASPECGFCASSANKLLPGACLISNVTTKDQCHIEERLWYTRGCPSKFGWLAIVGLALYIIFFSPGMGTVPWVVNSEIYPLRYRGICGGMASTSNWVSNLIVAQSFLSLTQAIGTAWTFMIFIFITVAAIIFVIILVPETKGLPMEEVEKMLERNSLNFKFWQRSSRNGEQVPAQKTESI